MPKEKDYGIYGNLKITGETTVMAEVESSDRLKMDDFNVISGTGKLKELTLSKVFYNTGGVSQFNITFKTQVTPLNKTNMVDITFPSYYVDGIA